VICLLNKKYYGERTGAVIRDKYDLEMLKRLFLNVYSKLESELYFQEATGYYCTDGSVIGKLGQDIEVEVYIETGLNNVWPIREHIDEYDKIELFTMMEFLFNNISFPENKYFHSWNNCGWHATKFDKVKGQTIYFEEISKLLEGFEEPYRMTYEGIIFREAPSGLEELIEEPIESGEPENVDDRVQYAITKFLKFDSTLPEKKDAIRTLSDVLEYYKQQDIRLPKKDDSDLFRIINGFDIRHHNKEQQGEYSNEIWYEWMFYTFLASIHVLTKLHKEDAEL
jgi:hypothetical protein